MTLCSSLPELNELAQSKLDEQLEKDPSLEYHFTLLKYTLQQAAKARSERDAEKTYLFLVMYMIIVVRKLKSFENELLRDEELHAEYQYNKNKVKKVKEEVEKFRDYLQTLYSEEQEEEGEELDDEEPEENAQSPSPAHERRKVKTSTVSRPSKVRPLPGLSFGSLTSPATPQSNKTKPITTSTTKRAAPLSQHSSSPNRREKSSTNAYDEVVSRGMESLVLSEKIQESVGKRIGERAHDRQMQQRIGKGIGSAAQNRQLHASLGEAIASSTDNQMVRAVARNRKIQQGIGNAVTGIATNEMIQTAAGHAVHRAATDKKMQKRAAKGLLAVGKGSLKAGVWASKNSLRAGVRGAQLYMEHNEAEKARGRRADSDS